MTSLSLFSSSLFPVFYFSPSLDAIPDDPYCTAEMRTKEELSRINTWIRDGYTLKQVRSEILFKEEERRGENRARMESCGGIWEM